MQAGVRVRTSDHGWTKNDRRNHFRGKWRVWKRYAGMQTASYAWTKAAGKQKARSISCIIPSDPALYMVRRDQMMVISNRRQILCQGRRSKRLRDEIMVVYAAEHLHTHGRCTSLRPIDDFFYYLFLIFDHSISGTPAYTQSAS